VTYILRHSVHVSDRNLNVSAARRCFIQSLVGTTKKVKRRVGKLLHVQRRLVSIGAVYAARFSKMR